MSNGAEVGDGDGDRDGRRFEVRSRAKRSLPPLVFRGALIRKDPQYILESERWSKK